MLVRHALSQLSYAPLSVLSFSNESYFSKTLAECQYLNSTFFRLILIFLNLGQKLLQIFLGIVVNPVAELAGQIGLTLLLDEGLFVDSLSDMKVGYVNKLHVSGVILDKDTENRFIFVELKL